MVRYHIDSLDSLEVKEYIEHRINVAGPTDKIKFSDETIRVIAEFSGCTPRLINIICDRALLAGFVAERNLIDLKIISRCIEELETYFVQQKT
jgi:general secretion pathway protein A